MQEKMSDLIWQSYHIVLYIYIYDLILDFNWWLVFSLLSQSLIFLACVGAVGLVLSLLVLAVCLVCLCCCRRDIDEDTKRPDTCCLTWSAVITGLIIWWVWVVKWLNNGIVFLVVLLNWQIHMMTLISDIWALMKRKMWFTFGEKHCKKRVGSITNL